MTLPGRAMPSRGGEWGAQKIQEPTTQPPSPGSTPQEQGGWLEVLPGTAYHLGGLSTLPTDLTSLLLCSAPYRRLAGYETRPWPQIPPRHFWSTMPQEERLRESGYPSGIIRNPSPFPAMITEPPTSLEGG